MPRFLFGTVVPVPGQRRKQKIAISESRIAAVSLPSALVGRTVNGNDAPQFARQQAFHNMYRAPAGATKSDSQPWQAISHPSTPKSRSGMSAYTKHMIESVAQRVHAHATKKVVHSRTALLNELLVAKEGKRNLWLQNSSPLTCRDWTSDRFLGGLARRQISEAVASAMVQVA